MYRASEGKQALGRLLAERVRGHRLFMSLAHSPRGRDEHPWPRGGQFQLGQNCRDRGRAPVPILPRVRVQQLSQDRPQASWPAGRRCRSWADHCDSCPKPQEKVLRLVDGPANLASLR